MDTPTGQAQAATGTETATGNIPAVDDLTTAIMTGAPASEIERLEAAQTGIPSQAVTPVVEPQEEQTQQHQYPHTAGHEPANPADAPYDTQHDTAPYDIPCDATTPPPGEQPADDASQPVEEDVRVPERIRLNGLDDRDKGLVNAANIIARTERIPFGEAWRRVSGEQGQAQQQQQQNAQQDQLARELQQAPQQVSPVEALQTEREAIETELRLRGADEGLFNADIAGLLARHSRVSAQLELRQLEAQARDQHQQAAARDAHQTRVQSALKQAAAAYPDLNNEHSPLFREANRVATDPSHPDYNPAILQSANAPVLVAKIAAANLRIPPSASFPRVQQQQAAVSPSVPHQPGPTARPAGASNQTAPPPPQKTALERARASEQTALAATEGDYTPVPPRSARLSYIRF